MCEKFIIIYYCIIYTYIFSAVKTLRKHIIFYPYLKNVDWKVLKVKDVPNDVVRVIICFIINSFYGVCVATTRSAYIHRFDDTSIQAFVVAKKLFFVQPTFSTCFNVSGVITHTSCNCFIISSVHPKTTSDLGAGGRSGSGSGCGNIVRRSQ